MDAARSLALLLVAANAADLVARATGAAWRAPSARVPLRRRAPPHPDRPSFPPAPERQRRFRPDSFIARFEMPWQCFRDLRLRLIYREAVGQTWSDERGGHLFELGRALRSLGTAVSAGPVRTVPVYALGSEVPFDIELQNIGQTALEFLRIQARQERYEPTGRRGAPAGARSEVIRLASLGPGQTALLPARLRLVTRPRPEAGLVNLEQTHVLVTQETDHGLVILLDAPQAGIIDPPFWADRGWEF